MSDESKCIDEKQFDKIVRDLHKWLQKRCCINCAIAVLGATTGSLIWNATDTSQEAREEAKEFYEVLNWNIQALSNTCPHQDEVTLQ